MSGGVGTIGEQNVAPDREEKMPILRSSMRDGTVICTLEKMRLEEIQAKISATKNARQDWRGYRYHKK